MSAQHVALTDCAAQCYCRKTVVKQLAAQLQPDLEAAVKRSDSPPGEAYSPDAKSAARRMIKNTALGYLAKLGEPDIRAALLRRFREASNMTDQMAAMSSLADVEGGCCREGHEQVCCWWWRLTEITMQL